MSDTTKASGLIWLWLSLLILLLDQVSKYFVLQTLSLHQSIPIMPSLNFTLMYNPGAAFSFLSDESGWQRWFFILIGVVISGLLVWWLHKTDKRHTTQAIGFALILGGAAGNLLDRFIYGHVIDFIDFYIKTWHWYTFNVADIAISLGVGFLLLDWFVFEKHP